MRLSRQKLIAILYALTSAALIAGLIFLLWNQIVFKQTAANTVAFCSNKDGVVGDNIALGCAVQAPTAPAGGASTLQRLTDGNAPTPNAGNITATENVYWSFTTANVVIDLEQIQPIEGISFNTAAGAGAVYWPLHIWVFTRDTDQEPWHQLTDIVPAANPPDVTHAGNNVPANLTVRGLHAHSRYIAFEISAKSYIFSNEIRVFRGDNTLLNQSVTGASVKNIGTMGYSRDRRMLDDIDTIRTAINTSSITDRSKQSMTQKLDDLLPSIAQQSEPDPVTFQAVLPLNSIHASVLSVWAEYLQSTGLHGLAISKTGPYEFLRLLSVPDNSGAALSFDMLRNEYRSDSALLTNTNTGATDVTMTLSDVPPLNTGWLHISKAVWTDTYQNIPVATALREISYTGSGTYTLTIPAGVTQKLIFTVNSATLLPGTYHGNILVHATDGTDANIPVDLHISTITMQRPRLSVGVWDYTTSLGSGRVTNANRDSFIALLQSHFVDTPWYNAGFTGQFKEDNTIDPQDIDFTVFDDWIRKWPNARQYMSGGFFLGGSIGSPGSPGFDERAAAGAKAIRKHMESLGIAGKFGALLWDEPSTDAQISYVIQMINGVKTGNPHIQVFEEPQWYNPDANALQKQMVESLDIISPWIPMYMNNVQNPNPENTATVDFYNGLVQKGKKLWFYQTSGYTHMISPTAYFNMPAWTAFQTGATGIEFWTGGDPQCGTDAWNAYSEIHCVPYDPWFLDKTEAVNTLQWDAVREGVEDYEYLSMLRSRIEASPNNAADKAFLESTIAPLFSAYASINPTALWTDFPDIDKQMNAARKTILRRLEELSVQPAVPCTAMQDDIESIGQKGTIPVVSASFISCAQLPQGTMYIIRTPDTMAVKSFDTAITRAPDGLEAKFYLYKYSSSGAVLERQNSGSTNFLERFPGTFAASPSAKNDPVLARAFDNLTLQKGIQWLPTNSTDPAVKLEPHALYILVVSEPVIITMQ